MTSEQAEQLGNSIETAIFEGLVKFPAAVIGPGYIAFKLRGHVMTAIKAHAHHVGPIMSPNDDRRAAARAAARRR